MQNFALLKRVGLARKPVLLKRGMSATLEETLMSAEYVMAGGNYQVVLCERGVRTFSDHSRNTLDLSVIPPCKSLSHLPIIVDPSHGTGTRAMYRQWRHWRHLPPAHERFADRDSSPSRQGYVRRGPISRFCRLQEIARWVA